MRVCRPELRYSVFGPTANEKQRRFFGFYDTALRRRQPDSASSLVLFVYRLSCFV